MLTADLPLTEKDLDANGWITANIAMDLNELLDKSFENFLNVISERVVGNTLLENIAYTIVGHELGTTILWLEVNGDANLALKRKK
jgi:hypothetical protein